MLLRSGLVVLLATLLAGVTAHAQPRIGVPAPDISLRVLGGGDVQLSALKGHPVIVTFWGTWCAPCRTEFPELAAAYRQHHADGLEIVAVNQLDQEVEERDVKHFVDLFAVPFVVALDPRGRSRREYRLIGLPTTVFIGRDGIVTKVVSGPISRDEFVEGLASIGLSR